MTRNVSADNKLSFAVRARDGVAAALLSTSAMVPAMAQPAPPPGDAESIVVTGTSIRGTATVGSNLITLDQQEIKNTGAQNVAQIFADMPAIESMGTAGRAAASQSNGGPGTAIYIHQLGANGSNSTLVLMDGHRLPWSGVTNYFVDPNNVPSPMIERIEVLAEGASAVYGSDAVAGVVNFITKSRFQGLEFKAQGGYAPGTHTFQASLMGGTAWSNGWIEAAMDFVTESQLKDTSRPWTNPLVQPARAAAAGLSGAGATNFGSFNCDPAAIRPNAAGTAIYLNAQTATPTTTASANQVCTNWQYGAILPDADRENAMIKFNQELTSALVLTANAVYSQRSTKQIQSRGTLTATAFGNGYVNPLLAPTALNPNYTPTGQSNPFYTNPPGQAALQKQEIRYDFDQLLGPGAVSLGGDTDMHASADLAYSFGEDWEVDALAVVGRDDDFAGQNVGTVNSATALLALNGTTNSAGNVQQSSVPGYNSVTLNVPLTAANALDVWNPASTNRTSAATLASLINNENITHGIYSIEEGRLSAQGSVLSLPAGKLKVALGIEQLNTQIYEFGTRPENSAGANVASQLFQYHFGRQDTAEFIEANIPVIGPDMGIPLIGKFDVDLALRRDDYSDFGDTTNYKASFNWDVDWGLRLRGNISTSFVAPPLNLVGGKTGLANFSSASGGTGGGAVSPGAYPLVTGFGIAGCTASSASCSITSLNGINISIGDATAIAQHGHGWSIGADYAPEYIPGLSTAITLWNTTLIGGMTAPQFGARVTTASLQHDLTLYPNCATAAQIAGFVGTTPQTSVFPACVQFTYLSDTSNYLSFYAQGLDIEAQYHFKTDFGDFVVGDTLTQMLKFDEGFAYKTAPTPSQTFSALGTDGFASAFPSVATQMRAHFGWSYKPFLADIYMNYTSAYRNVNGTAVVAPVTNAAGVYSGQGGDHVNANVTFDLHLGYRFDGGILGDDEISLIVQNLTNQQPPYFNSANGYDNLVANPIGTNVLLGFSAQF